MTLVPILRQTRMAVRIGKAILIRKHLRSEFREEAQLIFGEVENLHQQLSRQLQGAQLFIDSIEKPLVILATSVSAISPIRFCLKAYAAHTQAISEILETVPNLESKQRDEIFQHLQRITRWARKASLWHEEAFSPRDKNQVDLKDTVPYLTNGRISRRS